MRSANFLAPAVLLASVAQAHFTLDYPPARGPFVAQSELQFCSGYPTTTNRSLFPLSGGQVDINSHHAAAVFVTLISFDQNPTDFSNFNQTSTGQAVPYLKPFLQLQGAGEACIPVDVAGLGVSGVTNGTNATILVQYNGGDAALYACADVTLVSDTSLVTPATCSNTSSVVGISSSNSTSSLPAPNSTATASSGSGAFTLTPKLFLATGLSALAGAFAFAL